jgi:hypothetical protein
VGSHELYSAAIQLVSKDKDRAVCSPSLAGTLLSGTFEKYGTLSHVKQGACSQIAGLALVAIRCSIVT